jgi:hypothetical protein
VPTHDQHGRLSEEQLAVIQIARQLADDRKLGVSLLTLGVPDLVEQAYPGVADPGQGEVPPHRDRRLHAGLKPARNVYVEEIKATIP